jgi:trehalose-6-phosphatase
MFKLRSSGKYTFELHANSGEKGMLHVLDNRGTQIKMSQPLELLTGKNTIEVDTHALSAGEYILQIVSKSIFFSKKIAKI